MSRPRVTVLARDQGFAPLGWLYSFKAHAKNVIAQILPEPQASLLIGILLGDDSGIPKSVQDAFRTTGTSHVIAISGYNGTQTMFNGHTVQPDVLTIAFHNIQGSSFVWSLF